MRQRRFIRISVILSCLALVPMQLTASPATAASAEAKPIAADKLKPLPTSDEPATKVEQRKGNFTNPPLMTS